MNATLGISAHVYKNAAVMWRSAKALFGTGRIETPTGLRDLIEAVYGEKAPPIPNGLTEATQRATGEEGGARTMGMLNTIRLDDGYGVLGDLPKDQDIGTRLGEEVRVMRLARLEGQRVRPWADGCQAWARSEIKVRSTWLAGAVPEPGLAGAISEACKDWPDWDNSVIGVVADDGRLMLAGALPRPLRYDNSIGLTRESVA